LIQSPKRNPVLGESTTTTLAQVEKKRAFNIKTIIISGHVIHKKDEYAKKMEFFDESHDDGFGEKFGAFYESHEGKKGGHKKGGHKDGK